MTDHGDRATDPHVLAQLRTARQAGALFSATLAGLSDAELHADSLLPGWTRAHVAAHVGYNAWAQPTSRARAHAL
ncbi:MAG: maleylpyruvate isomerase N-terminal domain-containing protein [Cryobacterium sp.]